MFTATRPLREALFVIGRRVAVGARAGRFVLGGVAHTRLPATGVLSREETPARVGRIEGAAPTGEQLGAAPLVQDPEVELPLVCGQVDTPCSASRWVMVEAPPCSIRTLPCSALASSLI